MHFKAYKNCLSAFSICAAFTACSSGGPQITLCVSDYKAGGFQCVKPDGSNFFLAYSDSDNYLAMSPGDSEHLFNWIKVKCHKEP